MSDQKNIINVIGAGLAGSECAFQLAELGYQVRLFEMRKIKLTPAHKSKDFGELVCSNSFGSQTDYSAPGQLKWEAEKSDSIILKLAKEYSVPAGMSLSVDREKFAAHLTEVITNHPNIECIDKIVTDISEMNGITVIATGPLTDSELATSLQKHFDLSSLYFFDAIAPIIATDSIDMDICWKADRWGDGEPGDYINCPLNKDEYDHIVNEIKLARKIEPKDFEKDTPFFENCMPIEEIIERGDNTLRFGPLSYKGLRNPKTGHGCYAVVQLRQDNREATAYNMVGFQTKMAYPEQKRIFSMIPGLENAEFVKLGSIHRNMYINSPRLLNEDLSSKNNPNLYFAGQITGVEGYFDSTCIGLLVAKFIHQKLSGQKFSPPPRTSALGSLYNFLREEKENYQPMNINFSLFPKLSDEELQKVTPKKIKKSDLKRLRKDTQLLIAKKDFLSW
jgi:methylenetetrahydrofolate--tRNA-(uracil-5-)-methyltransferase